MSNGVLEWQCSRVCPETNSRIQQQHPKPTKNLPPHDCYEAAPRFAGLFYVCMAHDRAMPQDRDAQPVAFTDPLLLMVLESDKSVVFLPYLSPLTQLNPLTLGG